MELDTLYLQGGNYSISSYSRWGYRSHRESMSHEEHSQVGVRCGSLNNLIFVSDLILINNVLRVVEDHNINFVEINHQVQSSAKQIEGIHQTLKTLCYV